MLGSSASGYNIVDCIFGRVMFFDCFISGKNIDFIRNICGIACLKIYFNFGESVFHVHIKNSKCINIVRCDNG